MIANKTSLRSRLHSVLLRDPENREQLIHVLRSSARRQILDADCLEMMEGALEISTMQARDIMVPRVQMDIIDAAQLPSQFIPMVMETAHSRFPVILEHKDHVIGILMAKDLLRYYAKKEEFNLHDMLRPAVFIPESKPLNILLKEFRTNRNHIAIVVDEYGGVAGLVTIEDVLEQIVGDIEDEHDVGDIDEQIVPQAEGQYRVKALTQIADFNAFFNTQFDDAIFDTIGGLIMHKFAHIPKRGEQISMHNLTFKVLRADGRRLHLLQVRQAPLP